MNGNIYICEKVNTFEDLPNSIYEPNQILSQIKQIYILCTHLERFGTARRRNI